MDCKKLTTQNDRAAQKLSRFLFKRNRFLGEAIFSSPADRGHAHGVGRPGRLGGQIFGDRTDFWR
jgi:hypothetical protein